MNGEAKETSNNHNAVDKPPLDFLSSSDEEPPTEDCDKESTMNGNHSLDVPNGDWGKDSAQTSDDGKTADTVGPVSEDASVDRGEESPTMMTVEMDRSPSNGMHGPPTANTTTSSCCIDDPMLELPLDQHHSAARTEPARPVPCDLLDGGDNDDRPIIMELNGDSGGNEVKESPMNGFEHSSEDGVHHPSVSVNESVATKANDHENESGDVFVHSSNAETADSAEKLALAETGSIRSVDTTSASSPHTLEGETTNGNDGVEPSMDDSTPMEGNDSNEGSDNLNDFGDFDDGAGGGANNLPCNVSDEPDPCDIENAVHSQNDITGDDFGEFDEAESPNTVDTTVDHEPAENNLKETALEEVDPQNKEEINDAVDARAVVDEVDDNDEDFGDFDAAAPIGKDDCGPGNAEDSREQQGGDDDEFGDFGEAEVSVSEPIAAGNEEDDGDFGEFDNAGSGDEDDFGDFNDAENNAGDDDDDFGDFNAVGDDDGEFGDFEEGPPETPNDGGHSTSIPPAAHASSSVNPLLARFHNDIPRIFKQFCDWERREDDAAPVPDEQPVLSIREVMVRPINTAPIETKKLAFSFLLFNRLN